MKYTPQMYARCATQQYFNKRTTAGRCADCALDRNAGQTNQSIRCTIARLVILLNLMKVRSRAFKMSGGCTRNVILKSHSTIHSRDARTFAPEMSWR